MLKTLKTVAVLCGLILLHGRQAHASWKFMSGNDSLPATATHYSLNGNFLPCRAYFDRGVHPGWTTVGKNACAFSWGGLEHDSTVYELWVEDWEPATNGMVPTNALPLGYELEGPLQIQVPRYPCQAQDPSHQSGEPDARIASGKVAQDIGGCDYPWGGVEEEAKAYNVLVDSAIMVDNTGGPKLPAVMGNPLDENPVGTYGPGYIDGDIWQVVHPTGSLVVSGMDDNGQPLYLCATPYANGIQLGKVRSDFLGCDISYGGREVPNLTSFATFVQNWQINGQTNFCCGQIPIDQQIRGNSTTYPGGLWQSPVIGGHEANGTILYLCGGWVPDLGIFVPGKISQALGTCSIALNGKEVLTASYELFMDAYMKPAP